MLTTPMPMARLRMSFTAAIMRSVGTVTRKAQGVVDAPTVNGTVTR